MPLAAGRRLGPYEVLSSIGAGGMGEVYRALDTRLGRDVALKVLPADRSSDPNRLWRFEREARTVAALDHPHILALHDVGSEDGLSYVVFELLEGETLRQRLERGPVPVRKCVEWGVQICRGLAAAHARGIVHRDLKPENLCLTGDGRIKILDFGLASAMAPLDPAGAEDGETRTATDAGFVIGTVGYMSPEQARGQAADARSDLFSVGAVLYEMLSARRAFHAATPADTISAILHHDPPEITSGSGPVRAGLDRVVRRCLEKDPDERFQTARDLAFALESQSGASSAGTAAVPTPATRARWLRLGAALLALLAVAAGAFVWGSRRPPSFPVFKQLTFRRGTILDARFTADGNSVAYSGLFDGTPAETYSMRLDGPEALRLDLPPARLFGLSSSGELALLLARPGDSALAWGSVLARVPWSGGAPREVIDGVWAADWSPDGQALAVIRLVDGQHQLEYPVGRVLLRPAEFSVAGLAMRVSPRGDKVAFTSAGGVTVVDREGRTHTLKAEPWPIGLAWDPSGDGLWVGISPDGAQATGLWHIGLDGKAREAARLPGPVMIHDMSRDGRLLVHLGFEREGVRARAPGETVERDLCPLSVCERIHISADGTQLLLHDFSDRGSSRSKAGWLFLRPTSGGPPVRLGEGRPLGFSPDGKWALVDRGEPKPLLEIVPTGLGTPKRLSTEGLERLGPAWFSDDSHVLILAMGSDRQWRTYLIDLAGGKPTPVMSAGVFAIPGSLIGGSVLGSARDGALAWYALGGGEPRSISARLPADTRALRVSVDGGFLFVGQSGLPGRIDRIELATGRRIPGRTLLPDDPAGVASVGEFSITPDGKAYAYTYLRFHQDLYLIDGVR